MIHHYKARLFIALLMISSLAGCVDTSRDPQISKSQLTGVYTIELWSDHEFYQFGEPVQVRAIYTNVSTGTLIIGNDANSTPVMDLRVGTSRGHGIEDKFWSQANPGQMKYAITLTPQESYIISWTFTLPMTGSYGVEAQWVDPRWGGRFGTLLGISHAYRPPMP